MLSFIQSFTVFWLPANMGFQSCYELSSTPSLTMLSKETQEDRLQSFFAKDEAVQYSLSHSISSSYLKQGLVNETFNEKINDFSSFTSSAGNWRTC